MLCQAVRVPTDTGVVHLNIQGGHFDEDSNIAVGVLYDVPLDGTTATIAGPTYPGVAGKLYLLMISAHPG
jgi:hypothetical protein